jgi:Predicted pyridoxal phosphate-dependent enzyme apparently involved in regulation of cell wall biogenesis
MLGQLQIIRKIITNNCLEVSLNHKMDSITAASILLSLKNYKIKKNKIDKLANIYEKKLTNKISFQKKHKNEVHARYVFPILSDNRDKLMNYLKANKIESKIFNIPLAYDAPVHRKYKKEKLVNAERLLKEILIIPCHDKMNFKQLNYVIKNINNFFKKK